MDFQSGPSIEVSREEAIEELEEIPVDRNTKEGSPLHSNNALQGTEALWDR